MSGNICLDKSDAVQVLVVKAELHLALGEEEAGWALFEELRKNYPTDTFILQAWAEARVSADRLDGVEDVLLELLKAARSMGVKADEIECYRSYAGYLAKAGRIREAIAAQRELLRLVEAFNYKPWVPHDLAVLGSLLAMAGDQAASDRILTEVRIRWRGISICRHGWL